MEPKIKRKYRNFALSLSNDEVTSSAIRFDDVAGGSLVVGPAETTVTSLAVWAASSTQGSFSPLRGSSGEAVQVTLSPSTSQGSVYSLPDECYSVGAIKLVANHADATAVTCVAMLKG